MKVCLSIILFVFSGMYIYATTNQVNDKVYIGQSIKPVAESHDYLGSGILVNKAIEKYGVDNFDKRIIVENINNKELLNELEKHYIQLYAANIRGIGYNLTKGGGGFSGNHTTEAKAKISKNHKSKQSDFTHHFKGKIALNKGIGKKIVFENKEFTSIQSASRYFNIPRTTLKRVIKSGLSLKEYRETRSSNWDKRKRVLEIESGKVYSSSVEMAKQLNLCQSYASEVARENKAHKGLTYKYI